METMRFKVGLVTSTERFTYDRETGTGLSTQEQLINRWNMWEKSFDDDGESIPYEDLVKPIVYHMNVMFLKTFTGNSKIADDWNDAFVDTAKALGADVDGDTNFQIVPNSCNITAVNAFAKEHGRGQAH